MGVDFKPDWVSPPGDTILAILQERGISEEAFAEIVQKDQQYVSDLLIGLEPITEEIATHLWLSLGANDRFWLQRDKHYWEDRETFQYEICPICDRRLDYTPFCDACTHTCLEGHFTHHRGHYYSSKIVEDQHFQFDEWPDPDEDKKSIIAIVNARRRYHGRETHETGPSITPGFVK